MHISNEALERYRERAQAALAYYMEMTAEEFSRQHVSVSVNNRKTNDTPSVSLLPIITCGNCTGCKNYCYAVRMCRYPNTLYAWARNTALYMRDPARYWSEIRIWIDKHSPSAFRFHVGGEIPDTEYYSSMMFTARLFPSARFWTYTKEHDTVNAITTLDKQMNITPPANLSTMFSTGMNCRENNPHGFPTFRFIPAGQAMPQGVHVCGGHCAACLQTGTGCPFGQSSAVREH